MAIVKADATTAGITTDISLHFPRRNEPTYIPMVTPNIIKKADIRQAESADTLISPSLKKAVKHARMQSPRNTTEDID